MPEFIITTDFYTLIPWISGGWIIFGVVAMIALSLALGWWVGIKTDVSKKGRLWFAFGWIPIFGVFLGSVTIATNVYYSARNDLKEEINKASGINVITLVRGNESVFIGTKDSKLTICSTKALGEGNKYTVNCSDPND